MIIALNNVIDIYSPKLSYPHFCIIYINHFIIKTVIIMKLFDDYELNLLTFKDDFKDSSDFLLKELKTKNSKKYEQMFAQTNVLHFSPQLSISLHKQHNITKSLSQNNRIFCY